jgi:uncharacterized protein with HEPN domain
MPRDYKVYLEDMLRAIQQIKSYTTGITRESLQDDQLHLDAVYYLICKLSAKRRNIFLSRFVQNIPILIGEE